jgi:DNA/RNA endonuclease G (NUC1)
MVVGTDAPTLTISSANVAHEGGYFVIVSNPTGTVTSNTATLKFNLRPTITLQPISQTIDLGSPVTFTVAATSREGTLHYQWRKNGNSISGATSAGLSIPAVAAIDSGSYDVVVTNILNGTVTSITSQAATLTVHEPPVILTQPSTQTVLPPEGVTFQVVAQAINGGPLTFVWKKNGQVIPGATTTSYAVATTEFATNTDAYSVRVVDGALSTESHSAYAIASVPTPVYAGDPIPVPSRPITVLHSFHVDPVAFPKGAFRLGYDESLKNPVWSAYVNFPVAQPYPNSDGDYTPDTRLETPQVGKNDYTGIYTGGANVPNSYDRGHMVPRADISYRYTPVAGDDATMMSNLVPQISQFNQQTWQKLEEAIGGTHGGTNDGLTSFKGRVWVYTGSVFPENNAWWYSAITPGLRIGIPTACFKIVVWEPSPGQPKALAVLMPNVWGLANSNSTITPYVTSVARVEALTGLNFFPELPSMAFGLDIPTWKSSVDVRGWRPPFEQTTGPNVHVINPSYDSKVDADTAVAFVGAATLNAEAPEGTTLTSATWNFGDGSPIATGTTSSHIYTTGGSFSASFTVQDSLGRSNTVTRVITVKGANMAPTVSALTNKSTTPGVPVTVNFTVSDDETASGLIIVSASSDNVTLLPGGVSVQNANGACSLTLSPASGATGMATITVSATDAAGASTVKTFTLSVEAAVTSLNEGFDTASKTAYTAADVVLPSGTWNLNDALLGNLAGSDRWNGTKCIRLRNGAATMKFDFPGGAKTVTVSHAKFGTDSAGTWALWYSTNGGTTWTQSGAAVAPATTTLAPVTFTVNVAGPVRFELRKMDGSTSKRICLDDFQVVAF